MNYPKKTQSLWNLQHLSATGLALGTVSAEAGPSTEPSSKAGKAGAASCSGLGVGATEEAEGRLDRPIRKANSINLYFSGSSGAVLPCVLSLDRRSLEAPIAVRRSSSGIPGYDITKKMKSNLWRFHPN